LFSLPHISVLTLAIERIKNCPVLGVVERMDESLMLAEEILRPFFNKIDFSYKKQNVNVEREGSLDQKINDAKSKVNTEMWGKLNKENELDLKLYYAANEELNKRLKKIDNLEYKLSNFRNRC